MVDEDSVRFFNAVVQVNAQAGFQAITTRRVAAAARCSEALIYRHFSCMDELLYGTYRYYIESIMNRFNDRCSEFIGIEDRKEMACVGFQVLFETIVEVGDLAVYGITFDQSYSGLDIDLEGAIYDCIRCCENISAFVGKVFENIPAKAVMDAMIFNLWGIITFAAKSVILGQMPGGEAYKARVGKMVYSGLAELSSLDVPAATGN